MSVWMTEWDKSKLKVPLAEQGGELVAVLRGAKAPLLQKMIVDELSREKLVLEHGGERKAVSKTDS